MHEHEIWKEVRNFSNYEVSDKARVRRKPFIDLDGDYRAQREIKAHYPRYAAWAPVKSTIPHVRLVTGDRAAEVSLAKLVCSAFMPEYQPDFHLITHRDESRSNCKLENLAIRPRFAAKIERKLSGRTNDYIH